MISINYKNEFSRENINEEETTVSTLLIPLYLKKDFDSLLKEYDGNVNRYLKSLLRRFNSITYSGLIPEPEKSKTEFQEKKLNLQKVNFRPRNVDWLELGELALAFGKSRCWIFVFLLKLDILGLWNILVKSGFRRVVPTINKLELKGYSKLRKISNYFARGYKIKV